MLLSNFKTTVAAIAIIGLIWQLQPIRASAEEDDQISAAEQTLQGLNFLHLDALSTALATLDKTRAQLKSAKEGTPDYGNKLDAYKAALEAVRTIFESQVKALGEDKNLDGILSAINWDHQSFQKCVGLPLQAMANPTPHEQPAKAMKDETEKCEAKIVLARKALNEYIAQENDEIIAYDKKIKDLQKQYDQATTDDERKKLNTLIGQAQKEREPHVEKKHQAQQVKKSLDLGDILLALGEIVVGVIGAIACVDDPDATTCTAAAAAIASGVKKLTAGGKEETEDTVVDVVTDVPTDPATVATQNELKDAAVKPLENPNAAKEFAKDNPGVDVIPADGSSNIFLAEKNVGGVVAEVTLFDATSKKVLLTLTDASVFANAGNLELAHVSGFKKFLAARTVVSDDKSGVSVELRGERIAGNAGDILMRIFPLHPSGKVVAVGE